MIACGAGRVSSCGWRWWQALLWLVLAAAPASAQVIQLQGGSSSLLNANGGSLELTTGNSTGRLDLGVLNRPEIGFSYTRQYHGWDWTGGDQMFPFVLPTDLFDRSYYFMGRGLSVKKRRGHDLLLLSAGMTSLGFRTPYFNVARTQQAVGLVFYEHQLSPAMRFYSYNIFSSRQTSLQGFDWTPLEGLKLATTAGVGSNQGFWAGSLDYERDWIHVQTSYTRSGASFRRVDVQAPLVAETTGPNLRLQLHPLQWLTMTMSHQNYLNPDPSSNAGPSAGVDSLGASAVAAGFRLNASVFHSRTKLNDLSSYTVGADRDFWRRLDVGTSYYQSRAAGTNWRSVSARFREVLNRRFSLSQVISDSQGSTSVALGGTFNSNLFSIGLEHETFFYPFTDRTHSPFRQALLINVQLRLPHNIQLHASTNVDALGRLRYTTYADSYFYPHGSGQNGGGKYRRLPVYVVRGVVVDEHAHPIRGAALEIDGQTVFTDSRGYFLLRVKKPRAYSVEVLPDQFMFPGQYQVVSAPANMEAAMEETAKSYQIVVRQVFQRPPALSATGPGSPAHASQ
jgi:hypothetical protein